MTITKLLELPTSGVGCLDALISLEGTSLVVAYGYETEDATWTGGLRFEYVAVFRYADEGHTKPFPQDAYDTVIEISDSEWLREYPGPGNASPQWPFLRRHLTVFLSNCGYLEVIAERVEPLVPKRRPDVSAR